MGEKKSWYEIDKIGEIDSPALVIYADRVKQNIQLLIDTIGDFSRLRPHAKTHKTIEVTKLLLAAGIKKFKCATIAEAEMLAICNAADVLLAYQPCGPKLQRFIELQHQFPATKFSCLVDDTVIAEEISAAAVKDGSTISVYIDLNVGMNRTGIEPEKALRLGERIKELPAVKLLGLHAYDGHIEEIVMTKRTIQCLEIYDRVIALQAQLQAKGIDKITLVMGGSPSFPIYAKIEDIECSPGTFVFWDDNYLNSLPEQAFLPAALIIGRVISMPSSTSLTIDIGHKAISSEYKIDHRIRLLNAPDLMPTGHSEEHLVVAAPTDHSYQIGDVVYGLPFHVCPTCALHEYAIVVENHEIVDYWKIIARARKITI
jgi:D-serine deaminase-like pyridoxal phosphate-dependent protein